MSDTGYPGKKALGIGGVSLDRVQFEATDAAKDAVAGHEGALDPHPQYQLIGFTPHYLWGA